MFVVTLPISAQDPFTFSQKAKIMGVDLLEIRGDLTPNIVAFKSVLPLIITPRGKYDLFDRFEAAYVDLDINEEINISKGTRIIRSYHNFEKTPSLRELQRIALKMSEIGDIVKIAVTIRSFGDILIINKLQEALPSDLKRIVLGMEPKAHITRLLSPLKNELTYTFFEDGEEVAPGQIKFSMYQLVMHCKEPKFFGLLGGSKIKSLSPLIHNTLYSLNNIDAIYSQFLTDDLSDAFENCNKIGIKGYSVTSPFKKEIMSILDYIDDDAEKLETVNTVIIDNVGSKGYTCDANGLIDGYPFLNNAKSIAIIGSGGVVPSIIYACKAYNAEGITIYARNKSDREILADKFSVGAEDISAITSKKHDVIICAVSSDVELDLPDANGEAHAIDLRYNCGTKFLTKAEKLGYITHDGLLMLLHQALAQFRLFTGIEPSEESVNLLFNLLSNYGKQ